MRIVLAVAAVLTAMSVHASPCEDKVVAHTMVVRESGPECRDLEVASVAKDGTTVTAFPYEEDVPLKIERIQNKECKCEVIHLQGISGAHTRVSRFYIREKSGRVLPIKDGVFASEIGRIVWKNNTKGLYVHVLDADVGGKRVRSSTYYFEGKQFVPMANRRAQ